MPSAHPSPVLDRPPPAVREAPGAAATPAIVDVETERAAAALHRAVLADVALRPCVEGIDLSQVRAAHRQVLLAHLAGRDPRAPDGGRYRAPDLDRMRIHLAHALTDQQGPGR